MTAIARYSFVVASACTVACGKTSERQRLEVPPVSRAGLRTEALGCWRLADDPNSGRLRRTWWLPARVRLDTAIARHRDSRGHRDAWRLDSLGKRLLTDVEGFSIRDDWAADSASDRLTVVTGNGLYGAVMVLSLAADPHSEAMRGFGQEYGDVVPAPDVPIVAVLGTRVDCVAPR